MDRDENRSQLDGEFDIAIIGGGATGLGTAVDAASRGYKVALFEAKDFAQGTSSRSTKLVHGGVRYLAQGNISLVREALRERGRLRRNAPHLVGNLEFVVPAYAWWSGPYYGVGLRLYDVLAGKANLGKSKVISRQQVLDRIPNIQPDQLRGGVVYHDGQFDDARLAVALARTAVDQGAVLMNYAPVQRLIKERGRLRGLVALDEETGREIKVRAKVIVNATGVFTDSIRRMDEPKSAPTLSPSQGVHLVLPKELFPGESALAVPKTDDGRVLFVVPWHGRALLGTTDTPVANVSYEPRPLQEETDFLLKHAARYLKRAPTAADVVSVFVGLRPLVKSGGDNANTGTLSRDHVIFTSDSGLLTVVGGKWTTYRKMSEDTVERAIEIGELEPQPCQTHELRLHGAPQEGSELGAHGVPDQPLVTYGTDAAGVQALANEDPALAQPLHPRLPYIAAEVVWAVQKEMARTVEDVLSRRTRALLLDARASFEAAPKVAALMAQELGRDAAWVSGQLKSFGEICQQSLLGPLA